MTFDKDKVLTPFTADKAKKGDWGWVGDYPNELADRVEKSEPVELEDLEDCDNLGRTSLPFISEGNHWHYFYPASYEFMQKKWVEGNNLKVGNSVYVKRSWEKGEGGFAFVCDVPICQSYKVAKVCDDRIVVKREPKIDPMCGVASPAYHAVPFFAVELVEPKYRKFANAKEFEPHRDRWIRFGGTTRYRVLSYDDECVYIEDVVKLYDELCRGATFDDTGKPAGVEL